MSATMVSRLLELADRMIDDNPRSSAIKRRAVSTAYYAAFHALMRTCADAILPNVDRDSDEYERIYRAIDHGSMKNAFKAQKGPFKDIPALREIGELIVPLQSARIDADYAHPRVDFYQGAQAKYHIAQSRKIIERLNALNDRERVVLAVNLIVKDRSR